MRHHVVRKAFGLGIKNRFWVKVINIRDSDLSFVNLEIYVITNFLIMFEIIIHLVCNFQD